MEGHAHQYSAVTFPGDVRSAPLALIVHQRNEDKWRMRKQPLGVLLCMGISTAACTDTQPGVLGDVAVTLQRSDDLAAQTAEALYGGPGMGEAATASVAPDTVDALTVRVTRIEFLPVGQDEEEAGGWVALDLAEPAVIDLMALPTEGESPIVIASGEVAVGEYSMVRLFTDSASIRLKGPISLGQARTYESGIDHLVTIPSRDQTGLKTDAGFTVEEGGGNVHLLFSPSATFANAALTGNGKVMLAPVIRAPAQEEASEE